MPLLCSVHKLIDVITKAGGNRPDESLATSASVERCYILSLCWTLELNLFQFVSAAVKSEIENR